MLLRVEHFNFIMNVKLALLQRDAYFSLKNPELGCLDYIFTRILLAMVDEDITNIGHYGVSYKWKSNTVVLRNLIKDRLYLLVNTSQNLKKKPISTIRRVELSQMIDNSWLCILIQYPRKVHEKKFTSHWNGVKLFTL